MFTKKPPHPSYLQVKETSTFFSAACFTLILLMSLKESCSVLFCLQPVFLSTGVAGMMNWTAAIAPDVLKSRLQTGTT